MGLEEINKDLLDFKGRWKVMRKAKDIEALEVKVDRPMDILLDMQNALKRR